MRTPEFFIPVYKAKILCHSTSLDNISDFMKFIIWNIGKHNNISEINKVIKIGEKTIMEEINDLAHYKIISNEKDPALTDVGKRYFSLIECFDKLEKDGITCFVDLFRGHVFKNDNVRFFQKEDIPENSLVLEYKILDFLMGNDNYENSREIALEHIADEKILDEQYEDDIYTSLQLDKGNVLFVKCVSKEKEEDDDAEYASIGIPVGIYTYKEYFTSIDPYRKIIPALAETREFNEDLLSKSAKSILDAYDKECCRSLRKTYVDLYYGEFLNSDEIILKNREDAHYVMHSKNFKVPAKLSKELKRFEKKSYDDSMISLIKVSYSMLEFETEADV